MKESIHKTLQKAAVGVAAFTTMGFGIGIAGVASAAVAQSPTSTAGTQQSRFGLSRGTFRQGSAGAGKVTAISGTTITLLNRDKSTITVDATNAIIMKAGATSTLSTIALNDTIIVVGTKTGSTIVATKIFTGSGMHKGAGHHSIAGTVTVVNGSAITVLAHNGTTYTVDDSSAKITKSATSTTPSIVVGDKVRVVGTISGTTITATHIFDGVKRVHTYKNASSVTTTAQ